MNVLILPLLAALVAIEVWIFSGLLPELLDEIAEWRRRRDVVRRSAADQEMRARHAAQQLSLMAWRARHEMYDIASEDRSQASKHPAKHE